jgi:methionine synthase II (cobalamin-independent)
MVSEGWAMVQPAYDRAMVAELDRIASGIPHDELAIQWDVAVEFGLLEGVAFTSYAHVKTEIIDQLVRLGNQVPVDAELGYHLCYGDAGHKHFVEPEDTTKLVDVANGISAGLGRSLNWISMPVPRDRSDDAYFAPLKHLQLHPETELYLGLVHFTDGVEGTRRRIEAAQRVVADFGVATECGFGRRPSETIPELLRIHSEVAAPH